MGDEMQEASGSDARTEARARLETYFSGSGVYSTTMFSSSRESRTTEWGNPG
jgi:hypothetical protein